MSDTIQDAISSLANKSTDELFTFFEGQGIVNSTSIHKDRAAACPVAQYLQRITGQKAYVYRGAVSYSSEKYGLMRCSLPYNLQEFIREADRRVKFEWFGYGKRETTERLPCQTQ